MKSAFISLLAFVSMASASISRADSPATNFYERVQFKKVQVSVDAFAKGKSRGDMPKLRLKVAGEYDIYDAKYFSSTPLSLAVSAIQGSDQGVDSRRELIEISTGIVGTSNKGAIALDFVSLNVNDVRVGEFKVDIPVWYAPNAKWPEAGPRVYLAEILVNKTYIAIMVSPYEQAPVIHVNEITADLYSKDYKAQFEANLEKQRQAERDFARQLDVQARAADVNTAP